MSDEGRSALEQEADFQRGVVPGKEPDRPADDSDEAELFRQCWDSFERARQGGNQANPNYEDHLERWRGQHRLKDRVGWQAQVKAGDDYAMLETRVAIVTGNIPKPEVKALDDPRKAAVAAVLQATAIDWGKRTELQADMEEFDRKGALNGAAFLKLYWDALANGGIGEIGRRLLHPANVLFDPDESSWKGRPGPEMHVIEWFTPEDMLAIFGDRARGLRSVSSVSYGSGTPSESSVGHSVRRIPVIYRYWSCHEKTSVSAHELIQEAAPETEYEDLEQNRLAFKEKSGPMHEGVPIPKYPSGRVTIFVEEGRILDDRPNPYPMWNIIPLFNVKDPERLAGLSEFDHTKELQDAKDEFMSTVCDHQARFGQPGVKVPRNSGLNPNQITLGPGEIYPLNPGTADEFGYMYPPPIHEYIVSYTDRLRDAMERVTGVSNIIQGIRPSGLEVFATVRALQEAALVRLKPKTHAFDRAFVKMMELVIFLIQTRYSLERKILVSGDAGEKLKAILEQESQNPESAMPANAASFLGSSGKNFYFSIVGIGLKGAMGIEADRGNLIAMTDSDVAAMGRDLFQLRAIGPRALLTAVKWPQIDQTLDEIQHIQKLEQANEQMQKQLATLEKEVTRLQRKSEGAGAGAVAPGPGQASNQFPAPTGQPEDYGALDADMENALLAEGRYLVPHPEDQPDHEQKHMAAYNQSPKESRPYFEWHLELTRNQNGGKA